MSSPIDYTFMKSLDKCVVIIINLMSSSRNSIEFMMGNTILAPRWFLFSSTTLLPSVQHNLFVFCVNLEITATQQLIFLTSEVLPSLFVKNVVRISPPLNNSWYLNTSCHLRSFLGPRIVFNRNTDNGAMTCEFKTSSNPIALKLLVYSFILSLLLIESSFEHWSCYLAHISGAHFNQCLTVYVFLEHTSLSHSI